MAQSRADQSRPTVTWTKLTEFTGVTSKSVRRLARFACVGLIGVGVNNTLLWLLTEHAHVYYLLSSALATEVAILSNFTLNYVWTFAALRDAEPVLAKLAKFNQVALGGLLLTGLCPLCAHALLWPSLLDRQSPRGRIRRGLELHDQPPLGLARG